MGGLSSANWIIERIETFAKKIGEPFSIAEVSMLRRSIDFFNDNNRAEFVKVNAKTVRMIRETIIDEKLAGAESVEVREGLFIPNQWRNNYLEVYNSEISWLISHCAQSAMLHDPTLGETKNWESPKVISGTRKSMMKNNDQENTKTVPSSIEFELLITSIRAFLSTTDFLFRVNKQLAQSLEREEPDEPANRLRARIELLNILNSIGEIDDDATSAWSLFVLDEQIHETKNAYRNLLREKTKFGTHQVFSKTELKSRGLLEVDFCRHPSPFFVDVVAPFDFICKTVGVEQIFTKLYANATIQLAMAVAKSSVFTIDKTSSMNRVYVLASVLAEQADVLDASDPNVDSFDEFRSNLLTINSKESGVVDLLRILNWDVEIDEDYLGEWIESFTATTEGFLSGSIIRSPHEIEIEDEDTSEVDMLENESSRSAAVRLSEVEDLFRKGLLSEDEYSAKRKQIIDQI